MAMTGSGLSAAIKAAIEANYNPVYGTPKSDTQLQLFCDALGDAIVTYIQGNAEVPVAVAHVTGVQAGGGTSGPGTGTGTVQ